ncbi:MAG TPA: DUF433 domain-containing protein [Fimbriimonadaceae bacterium]
MVERTPEPIKPALGTGIYTISDAARLLQVSTQKLKGWAEGYVYRRNGETRKSGPILDREGAQPGLLTFYDLIELFFVREFRAAEVDLPQVRKVAAILREEWHTPYPFAQKKVVELERQLVIRLEMATVLGRQRLFDFAEEFFVNLDFDEHGLARAWHPLGPDKLIVLDPHRSFGAPIDVRSGIRTDILYRLFKAGDNLQTVADWYELPLETVQQAVEFEEQWQRKKAA